MVAWTTLVRQAHARIQKAIEQARSIEPIIDRLDPNATASLRTIARALCSEDVPTVSGDVLPGMTSSEGERGSALADAMSCEASQLLVGAAAMLKQLEPNDAKYIA
jgi:hypothetical protein